MLQPKRTKYRKMHKGRLGGFAQRGSDVSFGDFALQSMDNAWITGRQIEAGRMAAARQIEDIDDIHFRTVMEAGR